VHEAVNDTYYHRDVASREMDNKVNKISLQICSYRAGLKVGRLPNLSFKNGSLYFPEL